MTQSAVWSRNELHTVVVLAIETYCELHIRFAQSVSPPLAFARSEGRAHLPVTGLLVPSWSVMERVLEKKIAFYGGGSVILSSEWYYIYLYLALCYM